MKHRHSSHSPAALFYFGHSLLLYSVYKQELKQPNRNQGTARRVELTIACWIKNNRFSILVIGYIPTPQISMQQTWLNHNILKQWCQVLCQLLSFHNQKSQTSGDANIFQHQQQWNSIRSPAKRVLVYKAHKIIFPADETDKTGRSTNWSTDSSLCDLDRMIKVISKDIKENALTRKS